MRINVRAALLLAPLLVMTALPPATLAHLDGASMVTVHPESCNHGASVEESGSSGRDLTMDCSKCDDCCFGAGISAEPAVSMKINFVLKRLATSQFLFSSLTSLNFKALEHPPKLFF
ncbi:hypothetical protein MNBD_NITROSPINAE04-1897 [hydrothermal vent metagenome]|uniref:Uncharacterized protein n=1 Tax=hydrothermal vent metagenome TaxID=652676 RepID=A0A3B1BIF2_9ZZZZ